MCVSRNVHEKQQDAALKAAVAKPITEGEWIIKGNRHKVLSTGYHYHPECGGSTAEYYTLEQSGTNAKLLITAYAFEKNAKRPAPRPKLSITYRQLLAGAPCNEGLNFIAYLLGATFPNNSALMLNVTERALTKGIDTKFDLTNLYDMAERAKGKVSDEWLRYAAVQLNLVPRGMHHDRSTLLRLLGIED